MNRRSFLKHSLAASAGFSSAACWTSASAAETVVLPRSANGLDIALMAKQVLDTDQVEKLALSWIEQGADHRDLLGAAYLAGIQEVNPRPIGGQVHAMMMVPSALTVAGELRERQKLAPAIFNLQRVKHSQGRDASGSDWSMPEAPVVQELPPDELRSRLEKAMEAWDLGAADEAICSLQASLTLDEFFELLWPWAARDFRIIGHKIIYATQTYRVLQNIGWRLGRDGIRSLVMGILDEDPYGAFSAEESKHILAVHQRNLVRCTKFPRNWSQGPADGKSSFAMLKKFRASSADAAAEDVLAALLEQVSGDSLWDALRLYAFELGMQNPNIAGMHPVTTVNALYRASLYTQFESTRRLMILQAASWMPLFLPILEGRRGRNERRIDALKAGEEADPFASDDPEVSSLRAFRMVQKDALGFEREATQLLARKAQHDHDYKFTVATLEELRMAHPAVQPFLAGASMTMLRGTKNPDNSAWRVLF